MNKPTGFLEIDRQEKKHQIASERIRHFKEFTLPLSGPIIQEQATRCMDCGIPYCHGDTGCPIHNQIPDWNNLIADGHWQKAIKDLHSTNNFPEFTGRICPAPCEEACTLNLEDSPVTIKNIEQAIADKAWQKGWIKPQISDIKTGKSIAIIGSGPAGLSAAQQLARIGHNVHIYEREPFIGGLLRYGIPDFKMEKHLIDRRVEQMEKEGVIFHTNSAIGTYIPFESIQEKFDAILLACGAEKPRNPQIPGQDLKGCSYAMPYLVQQNRRTKHENKIPEPFIHANGKKVVIIGGGDTASDCVGTAIRQGALSVTQLDIRPCPPEKENKLESWPYWPHKMRTTSSQEEGAERSFQAATLRIIGNDEGSVTGVECVQVNEKREPIKGEEFILPADLVLFAIGFSGTKRAHLDPLLKNNLRFNERNNVQANDTDYKTSLSNVFVAGDMRRGQSLVVWAIREGRQAAHAIDTSLMGQSNLPKI